MFHFQKRGSRSPSRIEVSPVALTVGYDGHSSTPGIAFGRNEVALSEVSLLPENNPNPLRIPRAQLSYLNSGLL